MSGVYVEAREGNYYIRGSRVSLDSIVYCFHDGESPETIRDHFPDLSLEQIYGSIAFYLSRQEEIDAHLKGKKAAFEDARISQAHISSDLRRRLEQSRERFGQK